MRIARFAPAALLILASGTTPTTAASILDQAYAPASFPDGYSFLTRQGSPQNWEIQTFMAGLTGQLTEVDLSIWQDPIYNTGVTVDFFTFNGTRLGSLLGALTLPSVPNGQGGGLAFPPPGTNPFAINFNITGLCINVAAGQSYAIAASATALYPSGLGGNGIIWLGSDPNGGVDNYPEGSEFFTFTDSLGSDSVLSSFGADADLGFRTFVAAVPEPASPLILIVGLLGLLWRIDAKHDQEVCAAWARRSIARSLSITRPPKSVSALL